MSGEHNRRPLVALVVLLLVSFGLHQINAQQPPGAAPGQPAPSAWASAPIDLTGYWVSIVNEDWRWRMVTPPKGDFASLPLTPEATKVANAWDPSQDGRCEAYGAAALMRMPTRLHITWDGDSVLKIDTDAGQQTRRLLFGPGVAPSARSLQGHSVASWERPAPAGRGGPAPAGGTLRVVTTNLSGGWLRKNGVPYSENALVTEYFDRFRAPNGDEWLVVTTSVDDPRYLNQQFVTSSHFKKEPDGAKWSPAPCRAS